MSPLSFFLNVIFDTLFWHFDMLLLQIQSQHSTSIRQKTTAFFFSPLGEKEFEVRFELTFKSSSVKGER